MVNETWKLPNFIEAVVEREFQFDFEILERLQACLDYENCPHMCVTYKGMINFRKSSNIKSNNHAIEMNLVPSREVTEVINMGKYSSNETLDKELLHKFYTDVHYYNANSKKSIDFKSINSTKQDTNKETLEVRVWETITNHHKTGQEPIGVARIFLEEAIWYDGKIQAWPLYNEFGNKMGDISLCIEFYNQDLPFVGGKISTIIWNQVVEDLAVILSKIHITSAKESKLRPFASMDFYIGNPRNEFFYMEVNYLQEGVQNLETERSSDLYKCNMYVDGIEFFEFSIDSNTTHHLIKNTLNGKIELKIYKLVEEKDESRRRSSLMPDALTKRFSITSTSSAKQKHSIIRKYSNGSIFKPTSSFTSLGSNISSNSSECSIHMSNGLNTKTLRDTITIQRSYNDLSNKGVPKQKIKRLTYDLIFHKAFEVVDVPWSSGGLEVSYLDNDYEEYFKWNVQILHASQIPGKRQKCPVLRKETAENLLWNIYHTELQHKSKDELLNWNGIICQSAKNLLAILSPHFRYSEWQTMIALTLLKLQKVFKSLSLTIIHDSLQKMDLTYLAKDDIELVSHFISFCLQQLSYFDVTGSLLKSPNGSWNTKDVTGILKWFAPSKLTIYPNWDMELRAQIVKNIKDAHFYSTLPDKLKVLDDLSSKFIKGFVLPNLDYIEKRVGGRSQFNILLHVFAQAMFEVLTPWLQDVLHYSKKFSDMDVYSEQSTDNKMALKEWTNVTLQLYRDSATIAKRAQNLEQVQKLHLVFEPCFDVWIQTCEINALEQLNRVIKMEEAKDLMFQTYNNSENTAMSLEKRTHGETDNAMRNLDTIEGALGVKGIFFSATKVLSDIDWLVPTKEFEFGKALYEKLEEIFKKYIAKLQEMVLRDDEFEPHELIYILKSMFYSVTFLDESLSDCLKIKAHNDPACGASPKDSGCEELQKTVYGRDRCRDALIKAFCDGQDKHLTAFLMLGSENKNEFSDRICINNNHSFIGYMDGLLLYFERNLHEEIGDMHVETQLKKSNQALKENILLVGDAAISQYYRGKVKPSRDKDAYQEILDTLNKISLLKKQHNGVGNPEILAEIKEDIKLKLTFTWSLISNYLGAYSNQLNERSNSESGLGEICFNVGIKEGRIYVSLRSIHDLIPRTGYDKCNFSIRILLTPVMGESRECFEQICTPVVENKISYLFDVSSPNSPSHSSLRPTMPKGVTSALKKFSFSGRSKVAATKLEVYTINFELGKSGPGKFLELRLYDHSMANMVSHFRGHFILPITKKNVGNINILNDFLDDVCTEKFKIRGKFMPYLEAANQSDKSLRTIYHELEMRQREDPFAFSFVKNQKRLSNT